MIKLIMFLLPIFIASCNQKNSQYNSEVKNKSDYLDKNEVVSSLNIFWDAPKNWQEYQSSSSMRLASYKVPYENDNFSNYGDLSITVLSGFGGNLHSNVNRWRRQVGLKPKPLNDIMNESLEQINQIGKYYIFKIINDNNANSAFICAVMSTVNSTIFVKLNVKPEKIDKLEKSFVDFCQTFVMK